MRNTEKVQNASRPLAKAIPVYNKSRCLTYVLPSLDLLVVLNTIRVKSNDIKKCVIFYINHAQYHFK
jgi:hypothetical protein